MDTSAAQTAIQLALSGKWNEAVDANLGILKSSPDDTEAMCRLARAYYELGELDQARGTTKKILQIEPTNQIAIKFFEKLKIIKSSDGHVSSLPYGESFLEEPGKTKLINLFNLGEPENFINLDPGEEVKLAAYSHRVSVTTNDGKYIGRVPDDIAARLKYLIKGGSKYQTLIKSASPKEITIFVRELEKGSGTDGSPSFPPEKLEYVSFTPPELVHRDTPSVETTEEIPEE